jgi:hypothetical protein
MASRPAVWALATLLVLAGCNQSATSPSPTAIQSEVPDFTPSPTPTPTPIPTPTVAAAIDVEVVGFTLYGGVLGVRIHNPNESWGLVRARFQIAALAADGSILEVFGNGGVPGALCCTIYQLPPGGDFVFSEPTENESRISSIEFSLVDDWIPWAGLVVPAVSIADVTASAEFAFAIKVVGRVSAAEDAPTVNVWVGFELEQGGSLIYVSDTVDCVRPGETRVFEAAGFADDGLGDSFAVNTALAYSTIVPGVEGQPSTAPGC